MHIEKTKVSVEYLNVVYIFDGDLSIIFGVANTDVFWYVEGTPSTPDTDGYTTALCIDSASGTLVWQQTFIEKYDSENDNDFYMTLIAHVRRTCNIDESLPINIYQPASPNTSDKNERFKIFWYSVEDEKPG